MRHKKSEPTNTFYRDFGKRFFDICFSFAGIFVLLPLLAIVATMVRLCIGSPVLFRQQRPGLHGRSFTLYKFRTMSDARDFQGNLLSDGERLVPFGRFLRNSSLDELPELWNVILGNMSLVGPRPLLEEYLDRYSPFQMRRHEVKPGITGWAQINGRNAISWPQKFELDVWYVEHLFFFIDIKILWGTLKTVVKRTGVSSKGHATMPVFSGNEDEEA